MNFIKHIIAIVLLTIITQVGGIFYLFGVFIYKVLGFKKISLKLVVISIIYLVGIMFVVPPIAKLNNRVAMPVFKANKMHVGPHTLFTVLANRHYVKPELKSLVLNAAKEVNQKYPGVKVEYLDGSFPLFKEWRMLPHLKHDDGSKLDVSFVRKKSNSNKYSNRYFSFFGYGFSEKPKNGEEDYPAKCEEQGKWQYNIIEKVVPDQHWRKLELPIAENAFLLKSIIDQEACRYVFIEPHLKTRLGFSNNSKIRFHGCWAVRHDDHMHIQINRK